MNILALNAGNTNPQKRPTVRPSAQRAVHIHPHLAHKPKNHRAKPTPTTRLQTPRKASSSPVNRTYSASSATSTSPPPLRTHTPPSSPANPTYPTPPPTSASSPMRSPEPPPAPPFQHGRRMPSHVAAASRRPRATLPMLSFLVAYISVAVRAKSAAAEHGMWQWASKENCTLGYCAYLPGTMRWKCVYRRRTQVS